MIQSFRTMQRLGLLDAISEDKLDAVDLLIFDSQAHIRVRQETLGSYIYILLLLYICY